MSSFEDPGLDGPTFQFTSLTPANREDIVYLSGDLNLPGAEFVTANALALSALGTTADFDGRWNYRPTGNDPPISLVSWRHIATTGRDIYVRVVNKGYLFPLGHETVIVSVVERVVVADPTNQGYADAYSRNSSTSGSSSRSRTTPPRANRSAPRIGRSPRCRS